MDYPAVGLRGIFLNKNGDIESAKKLNLFVKEIL
jgi:hypothetical protein